MESKGWFQSKTILTGIGIVAGGLVQLIPILISWIEAGHTIGGVMTLLWPALATFAGVLVVAFRKGATQPIQ